VVTHGILDADPAAFGEGRVRVNDLITHRVPLDESRAPFNWLVPKRAHGQVMITYQ